MEELTAKEVINVTFKLLRHYGKIVTDTQMQLSTGFVRITEYQYDDLLFLVVMHNGSVEVVNQVK